jgi:hypothetical protein
MKKINIISVCMMVLFASCGDNDLGINPKNENYPFRIVFDTDEGGDLPEAEDYEIEIKFADYLGSLPGKPVTLQYAINDTEGDMVDAVNIDKIIYEVEMNDCVYERELDFTVNGLTGTITLAVDEDLGTVPEAFEVVLTLPGLENTEGGFVFEITSVQTEDNVILGMPAAFEYAVLDNAVAGEWELEIATEEAFEEFKEVFGMLNAELQTLEFTDITGTVKAEFEFGEMKLVIELVETEEITECKDGEEETEIVHKELEIEADYEAEDGELAFEGSHVIDDDGAEVELDFIVDAAYEIIEETGEISVTFFKIVDEDNYEAGEELFASQDGIVFVFSKD